MIHYQDDTVQLHHGDCLDVLRALPDCSVDAVVCDPPYGLANTTPAQVAETITAWVSGDREHLPTGKGFMGKSWDAFVPPVAVWDECLRVLKPGGHALVFAGSRTHDLMTLGLRLAGFDIRDTISWLYGSGFPKSLDIGKAIDKRPGVQRHAEFAQHLTERREANHLTRAEVSQFVVGTPSGACWNWEHHQFPEAKWWPALRGLLGLDEDKWGPVIAEAERAKIGTRTTGIGTGRGVVSYIADSNNRDITAPATPAAQQWQGWGSALKPSQEPIVVARKPLTGTLAANVLQWGTGGLNIDGTRIKYQSDSDKASARPQGAATSRVGALAGKSQTWTTASATEQTAPSTTAETMGTSASLTGESAPSATGTARTAFTPTESAGRWPTNVVLDDTAAEALDAGQPTSRDGVAVQRHGGGQRIFNQGDGLTREDQGYGGEGGPSRFFPVFKSDPPVLCALSGMLMGCENVPTAATTSQPTSPKPSTAPSLVPDTQQQQGAARSGESTSPASTADESGRTTPAITATTAPEAAPTRFAGPSDLPAWCAELLCGSCATAIARSVAATHLGHSVSRALGLPSTGDSSELSLTQSLVRFAEALASPGTTSTTTASTTSLGSVAHAISAYTIKVSQLDARRSEASSPAPLPDPWPVMRYQAKAPTRERPSYVKDDGTKIAHPTVKPISLLRWMAKLVTPPGGTILEPFAGSGTTVEAAILEGFRCIAVEREADYLPLIMARLERARPAPLASDVSEDEPALFDKPQGRWPTNVVLSRSAAAEVDSQSGITKSPGTYERSTEVVNNVFGASNPRPMQYGHGDSGGASRFFPVFEDVPLFDESGDVAR